MPERKKNLWKQARGKVHALAFLGQKYFKSSFCESDCAVWSALFSSKNYELAAQLLDDTDSNVDAQLMVFHNPSMDDSVKGFYCIDPTDATAGCGWERRPTWFEKTSPKFLFGSELYAEMSEGTDLEGSGAAGCTALHFACWIKDPEAIMTLLHHGVSNFSQIETNVKTTFTVRAEHKKHQHHTAQTITFLHFSSKLLPCLACRPAPKSNAGMGGSLLT